MFPTYHFEENRMAPKPKARKKKTVEPNEMIILESKAGSDDAGVEHTVPEPNVLTPEKIQDATDILVDAKSKYMIEEADHTWGPLIKLSPDLLSPFEKKFVDDIKLNRLEKNVKNFSIACAIVGRYCD